MSENQLLIRDLAKTFDPGLFEEKREILKGVDLEVRRGEIFGFLGPNGSGKTTTIKAVTGLIKPDRGTIEICGLPHTDLSAKKRVGFMPENPYFYQHLTGREFLLFYSRLLGLSDGQSKQRCAEVIAQVGMEEHQTAPMKTFSKGMLQRMALAQALLGEPELLILDEPMSGLDPLGRRDVRDIVLSLKKSGTTIFFSSHIIPDVETLCDRVGILSGGRVRAIGTVKEIVAQEVETFEVAFHGVDLDELQTPLLESHRGSDSIWVRIEAKNRDLLISELTERGGQLLRLTPLRSSLERFLLDQYQEEAS